MFTLTGKYNTANIFAATLEQTAVSQVIELLNQQFCANSTIRIMPDAHAGAGCVIGTTMTLHGSVVPNLVGVDICCGVHAQHLSRAPDFVALDQVIRQHVPSGFNIRTQYHRMVDQAPLDKLVCRDHVNLNRAHLSVGTLGGGNHFIEVNQDESGDHWLVVHSGSRNIGKQVADYYQAEAIRQCRGQDHGQAELIARLKRENRAAEISDEVKKLQVPKIPSYLAYCTGELFDQYIHDMGVIQNYAAVNRIAITDTIDQHLGLNGPGGSFCTLHNYIETDVSPMMLRKGAVAAHSGQRILIPLNMRDGSILCRGKGNPDWNESAPHGAGRLMGRGEAKRCLDVKQFQDDMVTVYTTCVGRSTLDEAPRAYKPKEEILSVIHETVDILETWKPVYNFKATN